MVVCNVAILWALKRSRGSGKDEMNPMKRKAFKMVLSILIIIISNYLPPVALFPFEDHYPHKVFTCYVQPACFAFVNIKQHYPAFNLFVPFGESTILGQHLCGRN